MMLANSENSYTPHVLVVEDSDEDFDTLLEAIKHSGSTNTIHRAVSGASCLAMLKGSTSERLSVLPGLILMDLNAHGLDGRDALLEIKTTPQLKHIPVVVLTTSANVKDVAYCYAAGANAYHVKTVRHDEYLRLLQSLLNYWLDTVTSIPSTTKVG
jgi:CheY-like chemotaxis protein